MYRLNKTLLYLFLIVLVLIAITCVAFTGLHFQPKEPTPIPEPTVTVETVEVEKLVEVEKIVEVEKTITSEILEDGLRDLGTLITEEYFFTEVTNFSSVLKDPIFKKDMIFTESSYLLSYDGVVTAGINFTDIQVQKDEATNAIIVTLPKSEIQNVDIDLNSFQKYAEKSSIFNPVSVADYNYSLIELETAATEKAIQRGLLDRADENAKNVVRNFVGSLIDSNVYTLIFAAE